VARYWSLRKGANVVWARRYCSKSDPERRPAPPMRDDRGGRLRATRLAQLLVDITGVDREAAGRAERFAVRPGESGNDRRFDHPRHPTSNSVDCVRQSRSRIGVEAWRSSLASL
jgi:hypothetical protein